MSRKCLTSVDTAWLRMEDPTNLMMITGIMVLGAPMDFDRFKATIERRLLVFDRFRQKVIGPASPMGRLCWEVDPDLDLDYHLQRVTLAPPGDQAALAAIASELASTPLDLSRPLWQFHLVGNYGDGCALVCRLHHAIGDGIALVHVLLSLTDEFAEAPLPEPPAHEAPGRRDTLADRLQSVGAACRTARRFTGTLVRKGAGMVRHPSRAVDLARDGARGASALGTLVLRWPDPQTIFKGPLAVPKRAAWSGAVPLEDVKAASRGMNGTVNDVLLTAMAGALRRYLVGRDQPVDRLKIRAVVPVNLRSPGAEPELGNKFGLVFLSLPVGIADPAERLTALKDRMDSIKGSLEAPVAFGILNAIGMSPEFVQDIVVNIFGTKGTAVMTNVIGPSERLYLAGAPLDALMFWVPQSGHLGMGVSILSYAGNVWLGIITDEGLVPDPETIIAEFHTEFDELLARVRSQQSQEAAALEGRSGQPPSVAAISAALDSALDAIDAMLAQLEEQGKAASTPETAAHREHPSVSGTPDLGQAMADEPAPEKPHAGCQAMTRAGKRCRNSALTGSDYCRIHQSQ